MLRAGDLDKRVRIERLVEGSPNQDAGGVPDTTWTEVATVWAAVEPLKGREFLAAQQVSSEVTGQIRIRHRAGVDAKMRCVYGSRYYDVLAVVDPKELGEAMILYVREGANGG